MPRKEIITIVSVALLGAATFVYSTYLDWTTPTNLGANVNSSSHDEHPGVSPVGNMLYFSSNRGGNPDIWQSYYSGRWQPAWRTPTVYSTSDEYSPALFQSLYFSTNRLGNYDIYQSKWYSGRWQKPSRLPSTINTSYSEYSCCLYERGGNPWMVFSSNKPGGEGDHDLYETVGGSGGWQTPWRLPNPSSSARDTGPTVTADGRYLYFGSQRSGGHGGYDLYVSTWTGSTWGVATNLGPTVNTSNNDSYPGVTTDGQKLYFDSNRPGGRGGIDIWMTLNASTVNPASLGRIKALFR